MHSELCNLKRGTSHTHLVQDINFTVDFWNITFLNIKEPVHCSENIFFDMKKCLMLETEPCDFLKSFLRFWPFEPHFLI